MNATKPTQLWQLNEQNNFVDQDSKTRFDRWIDFLSSNEAWPQNNLEEAQQCFSLLARTNIVTERALKLREVLFEKYPELLSTKIIMAQASSIKSKEGSAFFNALLSGTWKSSSISLFLPEGFNSDEYKDEIEKFEQCLKTGRIEETGKIEVKRSNVQFLCMMADYYQLSSLTKSCTTFISNNLDSEMILPMLNFAEEKGFPDLTWACLVALFNDKQMQEYVLSLNAKPQEIREPLSDKTYSLLNTAWELFKNKCTFSFQTWEDSPYDELRDSDKLRDSIYRTLTIGDVVCEDIIKNISKLNDLIKINGLKISRKDAPRIDILILAQALPNINYLCIKDEQLIDIPPVWEKSLKVIDCSGCIALTKVDAPNADAVTCVECKQLVKLNAANAYLIDCTSSEALIELVASNAKRIYCADCKALTNLDVPNAIWVRCSNCKALTNLDVPNAVLVNCNYCKALTNIDAPKAKTIECEDCYAVTNLVASSAEEIVCGCFPALTNLVAWHLEHVSVYADQSDFIRPPFTSVVTRSIEGHMFPALKNLVVLSERAINCPRFSALISLDAPNAININCIGCIALESLNAPKAKEINFQECKALIRLVASSLQKIICTNAKALRELDVRNAESINVTGCTALVKLDAQNAKFINTMGCIGLTEINSPNGVRILCSRNTALTEINAPEAATINCNGNTALVRLYAPRATEVKRTGCSALTYVIAPNAEFVED